MKEIRAYLTNINGVDHIFTNENECLEFEKKHKRILILNKIFNLVLAPVYNEKVNIKFEIDGNEIICRDAKSNEVNIKRYSVNEFLSIYESDIYKFCECFHHEKDLLKALEEYKGKELTSIELVILKTNIQNNINDITLVNEYQEVFDLYNK